MEKQYDEIPDLKVKTLRSGKHELKCFEGTACLPAWAGFQSRQGPYNAVDSNGISDGFTKLTVGAYVSSEEPLIISPEQVNAYQFIIEHQEDIKNNILTALLAAYKLLQEQYGYDEDDEIMPNVSDTSAFSKLIGLSFVHILNTSKDGIAYTGYEFGCSWDVEHGLGVMMHKQRIIEIGSADFSFEEWIAEKDLDPIKAKEEMENALNSLPPIRTKPWWKFW